jgi:hypothetical protein
MFVLREKATHRTRFSRSQSPAWNAPLFFPALFVNASGVDCVAPARPAVTIPLAPAQTAVILSGAARCSFLQEIAPSRFSRRDAQRRIPLRSPVGFRPPIPSSANPCRICTYKTTELTPLESALAKKYQGGGLVRTGIILNFRLSTANSRLDTRNSRLCTSPAECALTQKGVGSLWGAQKSTLFREKATHRMRFSRLTESSFCALGKSRWIARSQRLAGAVSHKTGPTLKNEGWGTRCLPHGLRVLAARAQEKEKQIPRASALGMTTGSAGELARRRGHGSVSGWARNGPGGRRFRP